METIKDNLQFEGFENPDGGNIKLYKCTECNFENGLASNYEYHMACHTRNQRIKCPLCSFSAKAKFYVARHLKLHHLNLPNIVPKHQLAYLEEMNFVIETLGINGNHQLGQSSIDVNRHPSQVQAEEMDHHAAIKFESMEDSHKENPNSHLESEERGTYYIRKFELVDLCDDNEDDEDEPKTEGIDKFESLDDVHQDNINIESNPESYLKSKEIGPYFYTPKVEFVDLCDEDEVGPIEDSEFEIEETECRKRISQYREDIRKARFCMAEIRNKIKKQKRILSEYVKQKEIKSGWLATIRANNQKVEDLSTEYKKLETLRTHIRETKQRKFEALFHLSKLMNNQQNLHNCTDDCVRAGDKIVVDQVNSDEMIGWLKSRIGGMQNELEFLEREERILARDVGLLYKCVDGIGPKVSEQKLQFLVLELEGIERKIQESLQDKTEDVLNQLVISTEEKVRNLFVLKNNLLDIMFLRKGAKNELM